MTREKFLRHSPRQTQVLNRMNKRYEQNILGELISSMFGSSDNENRNINKPKKIRVESFAEMLDKARR